MAKRKLVDSYIKAISTPGPYEEVSMGLVASLFLGAEEKPYEPEDRNLPHVFPKWEYPAIRDIPDSCITAVRSFMEYEEYVGIVGDGDLVYIIPKSREYYEKSRKLDWRRLRIMKSLFSYECRYMRLFGGGWTVVVDIDYHMLYGWHQEYGSCFLNQSGSLYYNGKAYGHILRTRLTWKSQSDDYKRSVYGDKVQEWRKGNRQNRNLPPPECMLSTNFQE